jgi:hypothetical protein
LQARFKILTNDDCHLHLDALLLWLPLLLLRPYAGERVIESRR